MSKSSKVILTSLVVLVVIVSTISCATIIPRMERSINESNSTTESKKIMTCSRNTPCAWGIYQPFVRKIDSYIVNSCKCPVGTECLSTDDDLSVSAYVHRCRDPKEVTNTDLDLNQRSVSS